MRLLPHTLDQIESPITVASQLRAGYKGKRPLLDVSPGTPSYPPPLNVSKHVAAVSRSRDGGRYTERPGLPELREHFATDLCELYKGVVEPSNVLVTAGCNQAFCLSASTLASAGDEVILMFPYYFNHDMWLKLNRIKPVYLSVEAVLKDTRSAQKLITSRTRAIVAVSPGNPTGVCLSPDVLAELTDIAKEHDITLILDETYKVFRPKHGPAHNLFRDKSLLENVVSLHSFSKEFAIPGYRVGAAVCNTKLLTEMLKLADCLAICAPRIGQEAAIAGLKYAKVWRRQRAVDLLKKQKRFESIFRSEVRMFQLSSAGAFFGWLRIRSAEPCLAIVRRLLIQSGVLALPGTIFCPSGEDHIRVSFGNLSIDELADLGDRLREFR